MPKKKSEGGLVKAGELIPSELLKVEKKPSVIEQRLLDGVGIDHNSSIALFQHSILCQTCIPSRDPGKDVRSWERLNRGVHLKILAGEAMHPKLGRLVEVGLPFGPKARLILMHVNQRALLEQSPLIHIEDTLSKFVHRTLNLDQKGRNIKAVKEQLARLAAASIRLGYVRDGHAYTVNSQIVSAFDIWFPKNDQQRVLWPSTIRLSADYWESLRAHAVPLDEDHIARLSHSSLALDIYAWLAQRLHRIPVNQPVKISWNALHGQFGQGYNPARLNKFRQVFRIALKQVLMLYAAARVTEDERPPARRLLKDGKPAAEGVAWVQPPLTGLTLYNSPPPVPSR